MTVLVCAVAGGWFSFVRTPAGNTESEKALKADRRQLAIILSIIAVPLTVIFTSFPEDYSFAIEYSRFLLFWSGFLGASMAVYQRSHLRIDFLRKVLKGWMLQVYSAISNLVALLFTLLLYFLSYEYIFGEGGRYSLPRVEGEIPDWILVFSMTFSFGLMSLRFIKHIVSDLAAIPGSAVKEG